MTERNKRHAAYEEQVVMLLEHRVDMDEKWGPGKLGQDHGLSC